MKKILFYSLSLAALLFANQTSAVNTNVSAENAITSEENKTDTVQNIYEEIFWNSYENEGYTIEGDNGADYNIWYYQDGWLMAYAYNGIGTANTFESYLVSPFVKLYIDNTATFLHKGSFFEGKMDQYVSMCIREKGGEWQTLEGMVYGNEFEESETGSMVIPAEFNNKEVQFGFRYTADAQVAGCWQIADFVVKGTTPKRKEAGISYDVSDIYYEIGGEPFSAPKLNNPNNVEVKYESSNYSVAYVDVNTGEVTIKGEGKATVTAKSKKSLEYEAGAASYNITVTDPTIVYDMKQYKDTDPDMWGFTEEGSSAGKNIWKITWAGALQADGFENLSELTECVVASPEILLDENGNNISFTHAGNYFLNMKEEAFAMIREVGGEWVNLNITYPEYQGVEEKIKGLDIPAEFNGKKVQIGFKYLSDGSSNSGVWSIYDLVIKRNVVKQAPGIAFEKDAVEYVIGSEMPFEAPALVNPNNVIVKYASDNTDVAVVDELTGDVTINGEGVANITATSEATDEFRSSTVSYTLTVSVPTGIECITDCDVNNSKIYDLQGRMVRKLSKGIFVVNGKKVIVR